MASNPASRSGSVSRARSANASDAPGWLQTTGKVLLWVGSLLISPITVPVSLAMDLDKKNKEAERDKAGATNGESSDNSFAGSLQDSISSAAGHAWDSAKSFVKESVKSSSTSVGAARAGESFVTKCAKSGAKFLQSEFTREKHRDGSPKGVHMGWFTVMFATMPVVAATYFVWSAIADASKETFADRVTASSSSSSRPAPSSQSARHKEILANASPKNRAALAKTSPKDVSPSGGLIRVPGSGRA